MRCQSRVQARAPATMSASVRQAERPVPISAVVAPASEIACGGEFEAEREPGHQGQSRAGCIWQRNRQRDEQAADDGRGQQDVDGRRLTGAECDCRKSRGKSERESKPRDRRAAVPLSADQKSKAEQSHEMRRHRQRIEKSAGECIEAHALPLRKASPASAIAPPVARTARRPAGQRASNPNAMPARCRRPVATTKPTE